MKHLVIIGAGAMGRELYWNARESKGFGTEYDIKGYIVEDAYVSDEDNSKLQVPFLSSVEEYVVDEDDVFICAIGTADGRESAINKIKEKGGKFISVIHNTASIHGTVSIGEGVFIGPFTVIGDSVVIADYVMLNTHSSIGHDAFLDQFTCVMSYVDITGGCHIGKKVFLASGCRMTPSTKIGDGAYVGIGSVVLRRVKAGSKVFGNPAKAVDI